jgi:DNA-binding MarR family transcriptional regulator
MDRAAALALLNDVLAATVKADGPDLNARQAAILLRVALEPAPHTVRGLAEALSLGKPAVSRALDALGGYGLAVRLPDETDRRSITVQATARGLAMLAGLADRVVACERSRNARSFQKPNIQPANQQGVKPTASGSPASAGGGSGLAAGSAATGSSLGAGHSHAA